MQDKSRGICHAGLLGHPWLMLIPGTAQSGAFWYSPGPCQSSDGAEYMQGKRERRYQMLHALHLVALRHMIKQHCQKKRRRQLTSTPVSASVHGPSLFGPPPATFLPVQATRQ